MSERLSIAISKELKDAVIDYAESKGESASRVCADILSNYLFESGIIDEIPKREKLGRPVGSKNPVKSRTKSQKKKRLKRKLKKKRG